MMKSTSSACNLYEGFLSSTCNLYEGLLSSTCNLYEGLLSSTCNLYEGLLSSINIYKLFSDLGESRVVQVSFYVLSDSLVYSLCLEGLVAGFP